MRFFLYIFILFCLTSCFYGDNTKYGFIDKPYLGEYNKVFPFKKCTESIILIDDSFYVHSVDCGSLIILDTAKYKFYASKNLESFNKMGITFFDYHYLYDDVSYKGLGDSIGQYGCFYTVENDTMAKIVPHPDLRQADFILNIQKK